MRVRASTVFVVLGCLAGGCAEEGELAEQPHTWDLGVEAPDAAVEDAAAIEDDAGADTRVHDATTDLGGVVGLAEGAECDLARVRERPCASRSACVETDDGWRCVRHGSEGGLCSPDDDFSGPLGGTASYCDAGLACVLEPAVNRHSCRPGLAPGALCAGAERWCSAGSWCVPVDGVDRCVPYGTQGGICGRAYPCEGALVCGDLCREAVELGEDCGDSGRTCGPGATCVDNDPARPGHRCVSDGALGARCPDDGVCHGDLVCAPSSSNAMYRRCVRAAGTGGRCDLVRPTTACLELDTCVSDLAAPGRGTCVSPGGAGAPCLAAAARCAAPATCTELRRYGDVCQVAALPNEPCDVRGHRTRCPEGSRCLPDAEDRGLATCRASTSEAEPNDAPGRLVVPPVTGTALIRGSLPDGDPRDCQLVSVGDGAEALFLEVASEDAEALHTWRPLAISLYDAGGEEVARFALATRRDHGPLRDVARLSPARHEALQRLPEGDYAVCLSALEPIARYTLGIALLPPEVADALPLD